MRHPRVGSARLAPGEGVRRPPRAPRGLLMALAVSLPLSAGCRDAPAPGRDAVQEAFREGTLTAAEARGHRVFLQRCATCHGPQGRGDGQNAYNLRPPPPDFQESLARLPVGDRRRVVLGGTAALGRSALCPPWGRSLDPDDVDSVLAWLDAASRPAPAAPEPETRPRRR
jgi:mono/diheme cytochrome c family protein